MGVVGRFKEGLGEEKSGEKWIKEGGQCLWTLLKSSNCQRISSVRGVSYGKAQLNPQCPSQPMVCFSYWSGQLWDWAWERQAGSKVCGKGLTLLGVLTSNGVLAARFGQQKCVNLIKFNFQINIELFISINMLTQCVGYT
jgi:hypothetical protein